MTFHTQSSFSSFGLSVENDENGLRVWKFIFIPAAYFMKTDGFMLFSCKILQETHI